MKSLFFLSVLFFVGSYGDTVSVTTCTTSTGCSGSDCNTITGPIDPSTCVKLDNDEGSTKLSCENNIYSQLKWSNNDCSGAPTVNVTWQSGFCVDLSANGGNGSTKFVCTDSAPAMKVFATIVIAVIAYFYQ